MAATLTQIASHESAHCVAAWAYGLRITRVDITLDPLKEGRQGSCSAALQGSGISAAWVYYVIAGACVDDSYGEGLSPSRGDFQSIRDAFKFSKDFLKMYQFFEKNPEADIESFYEAFKQPVLKLLKGRKSRRCIKALTSELLKRGTLSGQAAAAILEKAWREPLPSKALPVDQHGQAFETTLNRFEDLHYRLKFYMDAMNADIEAFNADMPQEQEVRLEGLKKAILQLRFLLSE